ncbi:MAG: NAD-dependent epimerase [Chitinophagales bacterium]|nr:MAG: NAD-dependent epimerase [Chitinophagales bacterium]
MENVLLAGGTGLIGTRLSALLLREGYSVSILSRSHRGTSGSLRYYRWNIQKGYIDPEALAAATHVINLTGAPVAGSRWTPSRKRKILESRVLSTRLLREAATRSDRIKTFINASAVGFYGNGGSRWLTETDQPGDDFLATVCRQWEQEAQQPDNASMRTVILRIGLVLAREGGALPELLRPMHFGIAPYFNSGNQIQSWIHADDVCGIFLHALRSTKMQGIYNAVAPTPVSNFELVRTLRNIKQRWALLLPVPAPVLRLMLGEMASMLLISQRCSASKIVEAGYSFLYPEIHQALSAEVGKPG